MFPVLFVFLYFRDFRTPAPEPVLVYASPNLITQQATKHHKLGTKSQRAAFFFFVFVSYLVFLNLDWRAHQAIMSALSSSHA